MPGEQTRTEIYQQPETWRDTVDRVSAWPHGLDASAVITGAGTSCYAALAVETAWPGTRAVASTDLVLDFSRYLRQDSTLLSLARSGDSPESTAVVEKIGRAMPGVRQLAITCNADGWLARAESVETLLLDPRTNDRSLVMTSSFSNLTLAGILIGRAEEWRTRVLRGADSVAERLPGVDAKAAEIARRAPARIVFLASPGLLGAAREAALKVLEMTAGRVVTLAETFLGLRHGPMSFVEPATVVIGFVSSDPGVRRYELDLIRELRAKGRGWIVGIGAGEGDRAMFDEVIETTAIGSPDWLRIPFDIVFAQLLGYHLSLGLDLDPDSPSPDGVITRVVQGVRIYEE